MISESSIANAFDALWAKSSERNWIYGRLGRPNGSGTLYDVPGQPGYKYVMKGSEGTEGLVTAQDRIGVAPVANQRVKMRREYGNLVIREAEQLAGGSGSGSNTLAGLYDVGLAGLADGNMLQYSASASKWINVVPAGGTGALNLNALTDVTLASLANRNYLIYDSASGQWINAVPSHGDLSGVTPNQHHDRAHDIITGDTSGAVHTIVGSAFQLVGATATNTLGLLTPSSNPGSAAAILRTDSAGGITIGGGMFVVTPSTHQVTIDGTTLAVDSSLHTLTIGGAATFNNNAVFNNPTRFNALPSFNTNLTFIGADRTITSDAGIDVTWDLGTSGTPGDLILAAPKRFRSADFLDDIPIAGFGLLINSANNRQLTINTIKSDSLHTRLFVADGVRINIGEERWGKSMGIVHDDFTSPATIGGTVAVYFENSPLLGGAPLFSSGDWVLLRYLNNAASFAYGSVWGQVTAYTDMGLDADHRGYQRWTFTMRSGDTSVLVKKGNVAIDYGVSGQGYVYLSTLGDANGPWFRIGDWSGSDPFTAGNTHIRTQIGRLDGIADANLNPNGWGLYSDNAFLTGMVRTAETMMDDDGLTIKLYQTTAASDDPTLHSTIAWQDDVLTRPRFAPARISAWRRTTSGLTHNELDLTVRDESVGFGILRLGADSPTNPGSSVTLSSAGEIDLIGNTVVQGHLRPMDLRDLTFDLGTASLRWRTLYVGTLVAGTITGAALGGQTWTYPASMTIDANAATDTVLSVTNSGTGAADLAVDRNITLGGTVDGVEISTFKATFDSHAGNPDAHHNHATGGSGITVSGSQVVAVDSSVVRNTFTITPTAPLTGGGTLATTPMSLGLNFATPSGLTITGGLAVADALAGTGLTMTAKVLAVNFALVPHSTTQMIAGAGLTGGGDLSANRTFNVVASDSTLTVAADGVKVNQASAFTWTGAHQFNSDPQLASNLDFIGGERNITTASAANLNIIPAGDLVLYPTGADVYPGGNGIINLGGYNRKWSTLYASELYVETLVASNVMATIGGRVMIAPTSSLIADFPIGATTIDLKHNIFVSGTWLYLETIVSGIAQNEAVKVNSAPTTISGGYRYAVLRGTGAPYTAVGPRNWLTGDAVVSLGRVAGDGYIDQASVQTIHTKIGPTITIYSRTAATNWNDSAPVVTMGNLSGFAGYGGEFGFATGNDLTLSPATGFVGFAADRTNGVRLFNTPLEIYESANKVIKLDKGIGLAFEYNSFTSTSANITWYDNLGDVAGAAPAGTILAQIYVGKLISSSYSQGMYIVAGSIDMTAGAMDMTLANSGLHVSGTTGIEVFTVLPGGNVGVGISSPGALLHVRKDQNTTTSMTLENATPGNAAAAQIAVTQETASLTLGKTSTLRTPIHLIQAGDGFLYNTVRGDIAIQNDYASGAIKLATAGHSTADLYISTAGNTGVGTATPSARLDVSGVIRSTSTSGAPTTGAGLEFSYGAGLGSLAAYDRGGSTYLQLGLDGGAIYLNAASLGNVGIGTNAPSKRLHIKGDSTSADLAFEVTGMAERVFFSAFTGGIGQLSINRDIAGNFTNAAKAAAAINLVSAANNAHIDFYTSPANNTAPVFAMTVANNQNVGINTASPSARLDVSGVMRTTGVSGAPSTGAGLEFSYAAPTGSFAAYDRGASAYKDLRLDGAVLALQSGSGGNVVVGRTALVDGGSWVTAANNILEVATPTATSSAGTLFSVMAMTANKTAGSSWIGQLAFQNQALAGAEKRAAFIGGLTGTTNDDGTLVFFTALNGAISEVMRLTEFNTVGIGTTSPSALLDVAGVIRTTGVTSAPTTGTGVQIYYNGASSFGSIAAYNASGATYQDLRIDANPLKLNASNNNQVGVATALPLGQLGVETTSTLASPRPGISSSLYSDNFGAFTGQGHFVARSARGTKGGTLTGTLSGDNILAIEGYGSNSSNAYMTVPSFAMYARATQAYNSGQTNGGAALDIYLRADGAAGNPAAPALTIDQAGNGVFNGNLTINNKGTTDPPGGLLKVMNMVQTTATGTLSYVNSGSGPTVVTLCKASASSRRFKKEIRQIPAEFGSEFLMKLQPSIFKYRELEDGIHPGPDPRDFIGMIAEDVMEAAPNDSPYLFVVYDGEGQPEALRYDLFTIPLIATAQQQERRIVELERRLAELERKLAA